MKHILLIVIMLLNSSCRSNPGMNPDVNQLTKVEFERLWKEYLRVEVIVVEYTAGKGDQLIYEYDGSINVCSDSFAIVEVLKPTNVRQRLRVSVARDDHDKYAHLSKIGAIVALDIPVLYLNFNPWGFVPADDLLNVTFLPSQPK